MQFIQAELPIIQIHNTKHPGDCIIASQNNSKPKTILTMKKTFVKIAMMLAVSAIVFTSCEKSENTLEPTAPTSERKMNIKELQSNPQFVAAYKKMEDAFLAKNPGSRAEFIAPFFTSSGFGLVKDIVIDWNTFTLVEGKFAFFSADHDGNDFYRRNNDGTVSVHVTSNQAYAEHYDVATNALHFTNNGQMSLNYTGEEVSFDITDENGNVLFTIHFIDQYANPNAVSMTGNGRVKLDGTGAAQNLVARLVANPGWTNVNFAIDLH